ncbi:MAG: hypothetical protein ACD_47C00219G0002 [uncultured bacterium]|nr:MAG: hypothetical protein ACD_47C00219G0002 [uncultured bacterium]
MKFKTTAAAIVLCMFTAALALSAVTACHGADLYKLCSKCGLKVPRSEDAANKFDINFCPACGNDLKQAGFVAKTAGEKVLELIKQKRRQIGDIRQLKASEWFEKGETSEDRIMKMACFINSIELDNSQAKVYNNLGVLYDEKLLAGEAVSCFRKAVELKPDYAIAINNLAKCLADTSRCDDAVEHYKKAIELEPANPVFRRNYADALAKLKKYDESIAEYKKSVELDKTGESTNIATFKIDLIERRLKGPQNKKQAEAEKTGGASEKNKPAPSPAGVK